MDIKKIGSFIAERRKKFGMTQQQLADIIGVSNKAVSKWETAEGCPDVSNIPELCKALCISADDFFAGEILKDSEEVSCVLEDNRVNNNVVLLKKSNISERTRLIRQGISELCPFFICAITMYYILPMVFLFNEGFVVLLTLFLIPVACVACGFIYTVKYRFSSVFALCAGMLFLPAVLYINQTDSLKVTITMAESYVAVTLLSSAIAVYIKHRYDFSIVKKQKQISGQFEI